MEKWKTQEAAFPTFPQGLLPEKKGPPGSETEKEAVSRPHH